MIVVGLYADNTEVDLTSKKLTSLYSILHDVLPRRIGLHILPFFPDAGDGGFAPNDWFAVRDDLGSWDDIQKFSATWNVIVDGIYNHVGIGHRWVNAFYQDPNSYASVLHAYRVNSSSEGPLSPRGHPALTKSIEGYYLWQAFSKVAIDIRLDNEIVQRDIDLQLSKFAEYGIWGVRLDGVAYYCKGPGLQIRHNPGAFALANMVADMVRTNKMHVWAQLDCDADAMGYFADTIRKNIPVNDYSYSAYLAIAMIKESPDILVSHIAKTSRTGKVLVRAPRTHDGILLRSGHLLDSDISILLDFARLNHIEIRIINDLPYELNCSAPFLYQKIAWDHDISTIINFTIAVTGFISGWSYYYFPYIVGFTPEFAYENIDGADPRSLNRQKVPMRHIQLYMDSPQRFKLTHLLSILKMIHKEQNDDFMSILSTSGKLIMAITPNRKYRLIANFSASDSYQIEKNFLEAEVLDSSSCHEYSIGPWGYVILQNF